MDFERRFGGIGRLYGTKALAHFQQAHVCVVGIGGVGSWAVEVLARSGIGELTLIDADHVAESNINRQLQALDSNLGMAKVAALSRRIEEINPQCRTRGIEEMLDPENLNRLVPECGFVLDCIDSFRVKAALIHYCRRRKTRIIVSGGAGGKRDPERIRVADLSRTEHDPLLAKTRKLLRRDYGFSKNPKRRFSIPCVYSGEQHQPGSACDMQRESSLNCAGFGSSMAVTAGMGMMAAAHVLNSLTDLASRNIPGSD